MKYVMGVLGSGTRPPTGISCIQGAVVPWTTPEPMDRTYRSVPPSQHRLPMGGCSICSWSP